MSVLFCHDGPLKINSSGEYFGIAHNDKTFIRYFGISDHLKILIRVDDNSFDASRYSKITVFPFEVVKIKNLSNIKGITKNYFSERKKIYDQVKDCDFVVVRLPSVIGMIAYDYAKKLNIPVLSEIVACPWDAYWNHGLLGKILAPVMYTMTKRRVYKSNYSIYVTNQFLQKRYPTKGKHTNCSNVALPISGDTVMSLRNKRIQSSVSSKKLVIGTTAAIDVKYKGQEFIIKAMGELKSKGLLNFEYQLVGSGQKDRLYAIAKKYDLQEEVVFLGPMKHADIFKWLDSIDIYAQPSRQEGLPRALIEAMSRGLIAIGAKTAGIPELIDCAFVFPNSRKTVKNIIRILTNITKKDMMIQGKRNFIESRKYSNKIIEERRLSFFKEFKNNNTK